jgi:hypothetical protein
MSTEVREIISYQDVLPSLHHGRSHPDVVTYNGRTCRREGSQTLLRRSTTLRLTSRVLRDPSYTLEPLPDDYQEPVPTVVRRMGEQGWKGICSGWRLATAMFE